MWEFLSTLAVLVFFIIMLAGDSVVDGIVRIIRAIRGDKDE